jgi:hypothetical protein
LTAALSGRRWRRAWLLLAVAVFSLALATRLRQPMRARTELPTGEAQWIWKTIDRKDHYPTAFYAIRDFDLESPPARARLLITADEEYVVTLNGRRIGAGGSLPKASGASLDVYEVGPLLLPGGNRLLVELRSARGAGGLLATLRDEATGRRLVISDESWRIFARHELGLVRGWLPINDQGKEDGSKAAFCWGYPPIARWGTPRVGKPEPLLSEGRPLPAASARPIPIDFGAGKARETRRPLGSAVLYDWGREVEGHLTLDVPPAGQAGAGLLFLGAEPPDPLRVRPAAAILVMSGRHDWMDAHPRRFRYAVVVGLARPARAAVLPKPAQALPPKDPAEMTVFGIEGPPLRTPVEDEVWRKLESLAGIARRKEL